MTTIVTLNAGSSSIKFAAYRVAKQGDELVQLVRGQLGGIGDAPRLKVVDGAGNPLATAPLTLAAVPDIDAAERLVGDWLDGHLGAPADAVGHRVVHGGLEFSAPARVDDNVLTALDRLVELAPLHQPYNLAPIRALRDRRPDLLQVVCFDTAFHHGHDPVMDLYAVPAALIEAGVRRYGFHGLSYAYIAERLQQLDPALAAGRVVVAHLGNGASVCGMHNGRSVDSSMGFSALDGLVMGTRPGSLDPGVLLYLQQERGMDVTQLAHLLYHECGLKGLSGLSGDMHTLLESSADAAQLAIEVFVHRAAQHIAGMAASLGGLDGLVFTAGIGENAAAVRAAIAQRLQFLGAVVDHEANARHALDIAAPDAKIALRVVPTDEEYVIARETLRLMPRDIFAAG